jgi:hypothetical protein
MVHKLSLRRSWRRSAVISLLILIALAMLARCETPTKLLIAPPAPTIVSAPPRITHRTTAAFRYSDVQPNVTFRCALDNVRLGRCPLNGVLYTQLSTGVHEFKIAARSGRLLSEPVWWRWKVVSKGNERDDLQQRRRTTTTISSGAPSDSPDVIDTFTITGAVDGLLAPGRTLPVNLVFRNPFDFEIKVVSVTISIGDMTMSAGKMNPGCVGSKHLLVVQTLGATPILPSHVTRSLEQLDVPRGLWPKVSMPDLATNQDACKNSTFSLRYTGSATKR